MKAEAEANGSAEGSPVAELGDDHPEEAAAEAAGRGGLPAVAAVDRSLAGGRLEDLVSSVRAVGVWPPRSVASAGAGRRPSPLSCPCGAWGAAELVDRSRERRRRGSQSRRYRGVRRHQVRSRSLAPLVARADTTTGTIAFTAARLRDGLAEKAIRRIVGEGARK